MVAPTVTNPQVKTCRRDHHALGGFIPESPESQSTYGQVEPVEALPPVPISPMAERPCGCFALRHIDLGGSFPWMAAALAYLATWSEASQLLTHWSSADQLHKEFPLPGATVKGPKAVDRHSQDPPH